MSHPAQFPCTHSLNILECATQFSAQILDVQPLAFLNRLPSEVHVIHGQLGLIKKPLYHEHWTWEEDVPQLGQPASAVALLLAGSQTGCVPHSPSSCVFLPLLWRRTPSPEHAG